MKNNRVIVFGLVASVGCYALLLLSGQSHSLAATAAVTLLTLNMVGCDSPRRLVFGFMLTSALLSRWASNTATTLMMLPVVLAVLERAGQRQLAIPLLLGIAYAASIGGMGAPIGTPPNLVFMQVYIDETGSTVGFC